MLMKCDGYWTFISLAECYSVVEKKQKMSNVNGEWLIISKVYGHQENLTF